MSLEVFAFLFWLGALLLLMQFFGSLTTSMLSSARAFSTYGRAAPLGALHGFMHSLNMQMREALEALLQHPRATAFSVLFLLGGIQFQVASPQATMGAVMGLWVWMALILPWAASQAGQVATKLGIKTQKVR